MGTRPNNRYELLTCALNGHELVGTDAATVTPGDALVVREVDGMRWHRCLRCDAWTPRQAPERPARETLPPRHEIEVPARGPILRDRYVLRLIALDRAVHVVVLTALAVFIFFFLSHRHALQLDYDRVMNALTGGSGGPDAVTGILGSFRHLFLIKPAHLYQAGLIVVAYAVLEATEMVGLWLAKRWAEYLTFVATAVFIPFEIYELSHSVTTLKAITFVINLAIAVYLLVAKRLFGVRGGYAAELARRRDLSGWPAIEQVGPGPVVPVAPALAGAPVPEPSPAAR